MEKLSVLPQVAVTIPQAWDDMILRDNSVRRDLIFTLRCEDVGEVTRRRDCEALRERSFWPERSDGGVAMSSVGMLMERVEGLLLLAEGENQGNGEDGNGKTPTDQR